MALIDKLFGRQKSLRRAAVSRRMIGSEKPIMRRFFPAILTLAAAAALLVTLHAQQGAPREPELGHGLPGLKQSQIEDLLKDDKKKSENNFITEFAGVGQTSTNGQNANNAFALDVNRQGDLLFQYANAVNRMVVKRGDKMYQVHNFLAPTPQGDYLIRTLAMDLRDDGTVYFLAVNEEDEVVLYEARPLF